MPTVYVTAPEDAADELARRLVEERLVACVNRVPCRSVYRWEGEIHEDDEQILLAKTTERGFDALVERLDEIHPYDVPCIERFDESWIIPSYAEWVDGAVR